MKTTEKENEIRGLLKGWYSATLSAEEERRLQELLLNADELPADLEAERELLSALHDAGTEETELPEEYSSRINIALEREMSATRMRSKVMRRRLWGAAAAVALFAVGAGIAFQTGTDRPSQEQLALVNKPRIETPKAAKTIIAEEPAAEEKIAATDAGPHVRKQRPLRHRQDRLETDEEETLTGNYHVVTDEREAEAMLAAIFGRLESQVDIENERMAEIKGEYETEMNKLENPIMVSNIQTDYHEES